MADFGISIAAKLIEVIGSEIIKEICDLWGYKSHLEELRKTILTIKNVLLDADAKRELTIEQQGYIRELKAAVYDADDLFDQFLTLAELNQIDGNKAGKSITYKVRRFFSSNSNKLGQAYNMSRKVKDIKKKLDVIVDNHIKFGLSVDYKPICRRTEETCSYVDANDIIGRDEDKEKIINRLLDPEGKDEFRLVTIVGVGGLGKTALAQLVYNDDKIREEFQALRLWVCVSDQEGKEFDVKEILCKIIETLTGNKVDSSCTMELVTKQFEEQLKGKKYILVLDDMWNEDRKKWVDLERFLKWGHVGSRILVTTRSNITTSVIGDKHAHILEGLSKEESWRLFEMSAFIKGHEDENRHELNNIGKKIIKKCYCNPLAIKVVGSLLYGQSINKWRLFAESGLDRIDVGGDKIIYILKLSYHNLEPSLKSCFSYCALFPKDFRIDKEMLISLWMAQGYVMPLYGEKNIEHVAEEYFLVLLRRCFFQDVIKDEYGEVKSVKMHDLMHDVAQDVGRHEICVVNSSAQEDQLARLGDKIRHVCYVGGDECRNKFLSRSKIRSFIYRERKTPLIGISNWVCLRVLYLQTCIDRSFEMSIDKLLLLRYLDLSCNKDLQALPNSITKLHNLQTLLLSGCSNLREFPKEFCKLVKLRHLNLNGCNALTHMPLAMDKLTNLRLLPLFVAGCEISTDTQSDGDLKSLKVLTKIKRDIKILICSNFDYNVEKVVDIGEGYLSKMKHLNGVTIRFDSSRECNNHETLLGNMEPHLNLKSFALYGYKGRTIPRWGSVEDNWDISFPNLTHIHLQNCHRLIEIPALSRLRHLRSLKLINLRKLEYMENSSKIGSRRSDPEAIIFFPSLEFVVIDKLRKLKGWWKREVLVFDADHLLRTEFQFRHLSTLKIQLCPNLTSFPPCPSLETLDLCFNNKRLEIIVNPTDGPDLVKLRNFRTENVSYLKSLPGGCISLLLIDGDYELRKLSEFGGDVFKTHATSLKHLSIVRCCNLRSLSEIQGLEHLTALERLSFCNNEQFDVEDDDDEPWKSFQHSLCNLSFTRLPNMTSLPKAMQHLKSLKQLALDGCVNMKALPGWISCLSSLHTLSILYCHALGSLPEEMLNLTSLHTLVIRGCSELIERCKEPDGVDFPKIQHIPKKKIG